MDFVRDPTNTDGYFVTGHQIFECSSVENKSTPSVDALMDNYTPFVTNKAEFSIPKTLMESEQYSPEINVSKLANALHKYSETQKTKMDLDESFNLRTGHGPQDSDSGISNADGLQLEELQCELKEKEHLCQQLRSQLDYSDRQHEENTAALTAERDSIRRHLNLLREENTTLSNLRGDYEDACERLCAGSAALQDAKRELEALKRRVRLSGEMAASLEADKLSLQELLSKSKDECHRINEMYAARQSALLEENETMKRERADLTSRLQDQDEFMQQVIKEKVLLEMELKDVLNKSNQTALRLDRSIEVSYTEDQMLTALDSLNADSRFSSENRILDEESFLNALREDHSIGIGRSTNMSLFDEIRMSFNVSRLNVTEFNTAHCQKCNLDNSLITAATQTDQGIDNKPCDNDYTDESQKASAAQTDCENQLRSCIDMVDFEMQTGEVSVRNDFGIQTDTIECDPYSRGYMVQNKHNAVRKLDFETSIQEQKYTVKNTEIQTEVSMQNGLCCTENCAQFHDAKDFNETATQTVGKFIRKRPKLLRNTQKHIKIGKLVTSETQTDIEPCTNNNNAHCVQCFECDNLNKYTEKLERDIKYSEMMMKDMQLKLIEYEDNLISLEEMMGQGKGENETLLAVVKELNSKIEVLEAAFRTQRERLNSLISVDTCCVQSQTEFDQSTVSTQADAPCVECTKRDVRVAPHRAFRRLFWEPLKCLFQMFAVVCFLGAVCLLYTVSQRGGVRCDRPVTPWRWLNVQDVMDLLLRIEYTSEVPM